MQNYDINLFAGRSFVVSTMANDSMGNALNLSGYNIRSFIKQNISDTTGIASFNATITNAISGFITLQMDPTGTLSLAPNRYLYDAEVYLPNSGDAVSILWGYVNVFPTTTW